MDMGEEWQVAGRGKGAARRAEATQIASASLDPVDKKKTLQRIRDTMSELRCDHVCQDWKDQLRVAKLSVHRKSSGKGETLATESSASQMDNDREERINLEPGCVCYGLGPFSSCVSARYQLAMLLLLLDILEIPLKNCSVYDPVFSSGEREVLTELGLTVLTENEEGKWPLTRPTLFYMMHCGKALYNNLLWKNWSIKTLPLLTIIGNSFSGIQNRMVEREFQRDYSYIAQALCVCEEKPLLCPSRLRDIFNDTALITFPPSSLGKLPQSTWAEPPEPQYQHCPDLEIILREGPERKEEED